MITEMITVIQNEITVIAFNHHRNHVFHHCNHPNNSLI